MSNLILLFLCLLLGILFRKYRLMPANGHLALNAFVINIALSALSLYYIPKIKVDAELLFHVGVAWINIILAILIFSVLGKRLGWSKNITGATIMCIGFGNTSFVGIPVIQAIYGDEGIKTVMLVDQPGSFVALSTIGIAVANYYSGAESHWTDFFKKMVKFPPFMAFFIALILNLSGIEIPKDIDTVFSKLGATTVPLALVSVGSQLRWETPGIYKLPLSLGLIFKLILFPLFIFSLYVLVLKQSGEGIEISILEAAMAPMITAGIIASSHGLEPKLCNLFVGLGIPLSLVTLAGWHLFLKFMM